MARGLQVVHIAATLMGRIEYAWCGQSPVKDKPQNLCYVINWHMAIGRCKKCEKKYLKAKPYASQSLAHQ